MSVGLRSAGGVSIIVTMQNEYLWDVFLSHNSRDKSRVRRLAERLREASLRVWFDEWVIEPGDDIYIAIEHGLEFARTLILCMSQAAFGSDWTTLERSTVIFRDPQNTHRRFIPLLLEDCRIPDVIRRYSYVDWRDESETVLERLLRVCQPSGSPRMVNQATAFRNIAPPGGAISHNDPYYITRAADTEVVAAAQRTTATLIIKGPRQFGKSSVLKHYLAACQHAHKRTVLLDFAMYTADELATYPTFLTHLAEAMWRRLDQPPQARPSSIPSQAAMIDFMEYTLLQAISGPVVLAFDEADKLLGRPYQADFFSMLRYWHERRTDTPPTAWARVSLALVISTEPYLLITDALRSPFNVSPPLELLPFNEADCRKLNHRYNGLLSDAEVTQLMDLLGGHPYLTRLAYYYLTREVPLDIPTLLCNAADRYGPFGLHLRALENKLRDEAGHLLLAAMQQVVRDGTVSTRDVLERLHGAGLVREERGRIMPFNVLYTRFFGGMP
jgi:hypothetical protein